MESQHRTFFLIPKGLGFELLGAGWGGGSLYRDFNFLVSQHKKWRKHLDSRKTKRISALSFQPGGEHVFYSLLSFSLSLFLSLSLSAHFIFKGKRHLFFVAASVQHGLPDRESSIFL